MPTDPRVEAARTPEERKRLGEIDDRLGAATPGRWKWHHEVLSRVTGLPDKVVGYDGLDGPGREIIQWREGAWVEVNEGDASLIAHAYEDLAYLRARLDEQAAILADVAEDAIVPRSAYERALGLLREVLESEGCNPSQSVQGRARALLGMGVE